MRVFKTVSIIVALTLAALATAATAAQRLTVESTVANIRSGPGTKYPVLWKVEKYYPIEVIKNQDSWIYFRDFEDDKGWIHKSLVGQTPAVIVKKDDCNVRSGPGTNHDIVFTVEKGIPFKELSRKNNWIHIQHADGDKGWIYRTLVW
jgi:SH3-like domain-containing protein